MNKLLFVCGPTGVGKTRLALHLAKEFDGELISADSRQVYKYMDVVTGKDVPLSFVIRNSSFAIRHSTVPYFSDGKTRIWGYDLVRPDEEWSVKHFLEFARIVIGDIIKREKLPIVVGGTGLYLKALTEPMPFVSVPRNLDLRKKLMNKPSNELLELLIKEWPERAAMMNESDRQNPRRLIRAIEIAEIHKDRPWRMPRSVFPSWAFDTLWIGLTIHNRATLYRRIDKRVEQRLTPQLWEELESLKKKGFLPTHQRATDLSVGEWFSDPKALGAGCSPQHRIQWCHGFTRGAPHVAPNVTIGYRQLIPYLAQKISKDEAIQRWKFAEHDYARRQLVWFKKQPNIHWFDITDEGYQRRVATLIRRWYDALNAGKQRTTYH